MNALLSHPFLHRLGITLFHALWEVTLLGLLAWAGLALLRTRKPQVRYAWACVGLAAMVIIPVLTFFLTGSASKPVFDGTVSFLTASTDGPVVPAWPAVSTWMPALSLLWALGSVLQLVRLGGGLYWLEFRLVRKASPAPIGWQTALNNLAHRAGLARPVRLLASDSADSMLVLGWLRPVILVPTAALLHLSPAALEAVLAHELAHIRRRDYLASLIQAVAESLLFFHPAAWWLSGQIRELREHCCDDEAAALCGDALILAEGLASLERLRASLSTAPDPALAATRGNLMHRITRLFTPERAPLPSFRGLAMTLAAVSLLGGLALTAAQQPESKKKSPSPAKSAPAPDANGIYVADFSQIHVVKQPKVPAYPAEAKEQKIQGTVVVEILVNEEGIPESVKAVEGPEALRKTAEDYAKEWKFKPYRVKGKPVKAKFSLTMPFKLK